MKKEMLVLFHEFLDWYNRLSFTHKYIMGFEYKGVIYAAWVEADVLPYVLQLDRASRGAGYSLRYKPTTAQKLFLLSKGAKTVCSKRFFEQAVAESKYNRGEIFEKLITEQAGQVWEKDNIPFTDGGDVTIGGVAYQIKFEKATFASEKGLARLM